MALVTDEDSLPSITRPDQLAFCRVMANLIATDHKVTEEERKNFIGLVMDMGLSPFDPDVTGILDKEIASPTPIAELAKSITHPGMRRTLYRSALEVALCDGLAPEEEKKLTELAVLFQLNPTAAKELMRWTMDSIAMEKREQDIMSRL